MVFIKKTNCTATIMYESIKKINDIFAVDVKQPLYTMRAQEKLINCAPGTHCFSIKKINK